MLHIQLECSTNKKSGAFNDMVMCTITIVLNNQVGKWSNNFIMKSE